MIYYKKIYERTGNYKGDGDYECSLDELGNPIAFDKLPRFIGDWGNVKNDIKKQIKLSKNKLEIANRFHTNLVDDLIAI